MPSEIEFQNTSPSTYGTGSGIAGLLFSSSQDQGYVTGSIVPTSSSIDSNGDTLYFRDGEDFGPYEIIGLTLPNTTKEGVNVFQALRNATGIQFMFEGNVTVQATITNRVQRSGFVYLRLDANATVNRIPDLTRGRRNYNDSSFIFTPYTNQNFSNSVFNPLISNAVNNTNSSARQVVDEGTDQAIPVNIDAIRDLGAVVAQIPDSNYSIAGIVQGRYEGSSLDNAGRDGDEPSLGLRTFEGSTHLVDATNTTIAEIQLSDRTLESIFFEPQLSGSYTDSNGRVLSTFPQSGSVLYSVDGSRLSRIASRKIFSIDEGTILTTDELGGVLSID